MSITGIHHITAIASDPQQNAHFYAKTLGLRLVKKTVNFDDPTAYHLYYGDADGSPGSIVTFFYWPGDVGRGRVGAGQSTRLVFSAPVGSLDFWTERLEARGVASARLERFGESVARFLDPDGIPIEIVQVADDPRSGWDGSGISADHALRGLHAVELTAREPELTEALLVETMGFRLVGREGERVRYEVARGGSGACLDLIKDDRSAQGRGGVGTIHHVAWSVPDDATQLQVQAGLRQAGYAVSPVMNRNYFHSIYYREKGGALFEVATASPGFTVDEPATSLGEELKLPAQFQSGREAIEALLPRIDL